MKTIMFFIYSLRMGGSEKACVRVANALAERYYITICTVFGSAGLEQEVSDKVNLIHKFPKFIRGFAKIIYLLNPRRAYKYLVKGRLVGIEGRIQTGSYTNRNGDKVYTTDVVANRVEFLEWGDRQSSGGGYSQNRFGGGNDFGGQSQNNFGGQGGFGGGNDFGGQSQQSQGGQSSQNSGDQIPTGFTPLDDSDIPF